VWQSGHSMTRQRPLRSLVPSDTGFCLRKSSLYCSKFHSVRNFSAAFRPEAKNASRWRARLSLLKLRPRK